MRPARDEGEAMSDTADAEFTLDRFAPLLGESFEISDGTGSLHAVLIEATDLREVQSAGRRSRQFSLVWRGPRAARLDQRIYTVSHPALGAMELFLVSLGVDAEGMRYEAVFT
jgi:hypothetical protein